MPSLGESPSGSPSASVSPQQTVARSITATPTRDSRPTLPPTWTREPSETPLPTSPPQSPVPTIDAIGTALFGQPTLEACTGFTMDLLESQATFRPGQDVTVVWTPVQGAIGYTVTLLDASRNALFERFSEEPRFTFDGALFDLAAPYYAVTVRPLNVGSRQMCNSIGLLINRDLS
jgi:hypothetical protein